MKHCLMAFLTSMSVSKHILFALGIDCTTMDAVKAGVSTASTALQCCVRVISVHFPLLHKSSIAKPRKTSSKML